MASKDERRLLQFLNITPARGARLTGAAPRRPQVSAPEFDAAVVARLREALAQDPERVLASAPAILGSSPSRAEALQLLNSAEAALRSPRQTLLMLQAGHRQEPYELPEKYRFPGYDPVAVPIYPNEHKFETVADALAWAVTAVAAWSFRLVTPKPTLPEPADRAIYPLVERDGRTTLALFSDWGTGYYHSAYIARHIINLGVAQAVHLGDVYYIGSQSELDGQFAAILDPMIRALPFYALNANHEMDSHGIPYLAYLAEKRRLGAQPGYVSQPQETSYFCLANDGYQVIGIDTAFHKTGRYDEAELQRWLRERLEEGAQADKTTILLSQNEPFGPGRRDAIAARERRDLYDDLQSLVDEGLIHAWFWGDEHFAALYRTTDGVPFVGSCVGHGGYPFGTKIDDSEPGDVTGIVWAELGSRFPEDTGLRQDRGNNGFCLVTLGADEIQLQYIDWLRRSRFECALRRTGTRLEIV